ncbi:hypothetical protein ACTNEO_19915 [Gracilibacillus sp. HCP3S3_G5_1]|uniref:hypothetical protein n=1 Tax=unclassified Gracilibacillus TaxID=2625209 RepID=UPI003F88AA0E
MSKRVKGIKIELEGETKGLDKALQDVNKRSSDVNKELRDVERLLKFNPGNTELVAQKQKLLADQVEATSDKLDQLKSAEAEVQQQFEKGEIGEEQYRDFQREVVETESKLKHYEDQLESVQGKQKSFSDTMKDSGEKLKDVGGKVSGAGSNMTKFITGPIAAGATGLLGLAQASGNAADSILDLSETTGMSTDAIQEWEHVATVAGVSSDTMTSAVENLTKKIPQLESEGGKATEALVKMGLSFDELKDMSPEDQMDTMVGILSEMEDVQDRNAIASQLFGGSWTDLAPVLGMGADEIQNAKDEAHELGRVMSEDSLNDANDFRIEMDKMIETLKDMGLQIGADLAPMLQDTLMPIIQDTVIPAIQSFGEKVGELLEWFKNLSPETQNLIMIIVGLVAAMGPILLVVGQIIIVIGNLMTILPALGGLFTALTGPVGIVIAVITALIAIGVALYKNWDEVVEFGQKIWSKLLNFLTNLLKSIMNSFTNALNWIDDKTNGNFKSVTDAIRKYLNMAVDIIKRIIQFWKDTFKNGLKFLKSLIKGDFRGMKDAVSDQMENIRSTISAIWDKVKDFLSGIDLKQIGKDIIQGLINGVKDMAGKVVESVKGVVDGAIDGAKKLLGIKSPSRVFMEIGEFSGEGLEKGLQQMGGRVAKAGQRLADNSIPDVEQQNLTNNNRMLELMEAMINGMNNNQQQPIYLQVDGRTFAQLTSDAMDQEGGMRLRREERGLAT